MAKKTTKKTAGKKTAAKKTIKKRATSKRTKLSNVTGTYFAKRNAEGEFIELDEVGRSLTADRRRKAKKAVSSGYGDQGDQPRRKRTAKKR